MNAFPNAADFTQSFERAVFDHDKALALADAFAKAYNLARGDLVTRIDLDFRLAEFEARLNRQLGDMEARLNRQLGAVEVGLTRQIGEVGNNLTGRLWSTIAVIAGVSTAISAVVGGSLALLFRSGGL